MESDQSTFTDIEDECRYWKENARHYQREWADLKRDYDELTEQSQELEAETDAILEQRNVKIQSLMSKLATVEKEKECLMLQLAFIKKLEENALIQRKVVLVEEDSMKEKIRQLEQKNDDLERAQRIMNQSILDLENKLDEAYEKNALLQIELDEMQVLQEEVQRLTHVLKDLKLEITVKSLMSSTKSDVDTASIKSNDNDNGTSTTKTDSDLDQQHSLTNPRIPANYVAFKAETRVSEIFADMCKKLDAIEAMVMKSCTQRMKPRRSNLF